MEMDPIQVSMWPVTNPLPPSLMAVSLGNRPDQRGMEQQEGREGELSTEQIASFLDRLIYDQGSIFIC